MRTFTLMLAGIILLSVTVQARSIADSTGQLPKDSIDIVANRYTHFNKQKPYSQVFFKFRDTNEVYRTYKEIAGNNYSAALEDYIQNQNTAAQTANAWISGKLAIGTTSFPSSYSLDVAGNSRFSGTEVNGVSLFYKNNSKTSAFPNYWDFYVGGRALFGRTQAVGAGVDQGVVTIDVDGMWGNHALTVANLSTSIYNALAYIGKDGSAGFSNRLVLGNLTTAPISASGAIYYNSASNQFQGYRNSTWKNFLMEGDAAPTTGSTAYIQNQSLIPQPANFRINGTGEFNGNIIYRKNGEWNYYEVNRVGGGTHTFTHYNEGTTGESVAYYRYRLNDRGNPTVPAVIWSVDENSNIPYDNAKTMFEWQTPVNRAGYLMRIKAGGLLDVNGVVKVGNLPAVPIDAIGNGGIYFNSFYNKFQGFRNGAWRNFLMEGDVPTFTNTDFIQNQSTVAQPANAWINGKLAIGTSTFPSSYNLDVNGTGRFNGILNLGSHLNFAQYTDIRVNNVTRLTFGTGADNDNRIYFGGTLWMGDDKPLRLSNSSLSFVDPSYIVNGTMLYEKTQNQYKGYRNDTWKNFLMEGDAAPASGSSEYIQNQTANEQSASAWLQTLKARKYYATNLSEDTAAQKVLLLDTLTGEMKTAPRSLLTQNLATTDLTLPANRTVTFNGKNLNFGGSGTATSFQIKTANPGSKDSVRLLSQSGIGLQPSELSITGDKNGLQNALIISNRISANPAQNGLPYVELSAQDTSAGQVSRINIDTSRVSLEYLGGHVSSLNIANNGISLNDNLGQYSIANLKQQNSTTSKMVVWDSTNNRLGASAIPNSGPLFPYQATNSYYWIDPSITWDGIRHVKASLIPYDSTLGGYYNISNGLVYAIQDSLDNGYSFDKRSNTFKINPTGFSSDVITDVFDGGQVQTNDRVSLNFSSQDDLLFNYSNNNYPEWADAALNRYGIIFSYNSSYSHSSTHFIGRSGIKFTTTNKSANSGTSGIQMEGSTGNITMDIDTKAYESSGGGLFIIQGPIQGTMSQHPQYFTVSSNQMQSWVPASFKQDVTLMGLAGSGTRSLLVDSTGKIITGAEPITAWQLGGNAGTSPTTNFIGTTDAQPVVFKTQGTEALRITEAGGVAVGTTKVPAGYKLAVGGNIMAEKVTVKLQSSWPDYVFSKKYKLPSLKEVEAFIQANNHLPEVPAAEEVKKDGVDLGNNQALLLKKVEELTLYIIDQNKKIENLTKEVELLKAKTK